jgi:exosortase F-associated protein
MLQKLLRNKLKFSLFVFLLLLLVAIRAFERNLFYDPFLNYFQMEYAHLPYPMINGFKLFLNLLLRYFLNSTLSIALLWLLFKDIDIVKFTSILYIFFGMILMFGFFLVFLYLDENNSMLLFYIRRFIIQPLFLLLFIPAFYYQNKNK